ncbi:MAG: glycosyl transferase [Patescibacteria group bacterium]|nr:MAG: glycosyl transferase [Patescibacteria group bacterium]
MICSVVIHTYNEEKNIKEAVESAKLLTDDIVIIDMHSKDNTVAIAKSLGARIRFFKFSYYVEPARNFGINSAKYNWVFILDADERITQPLAKEIKNRVGKERYTHYKLPRKNLFLKKHFLKHGGWWPDYQLRLIEKQSFVNWPKAIHSTPEIKGEVGFLKNPILHYFHQDFRSMVTKTALYEEIEAGLLFEYKRQVSVPTFFRKFGGELYRRLIKKKGYKDGIWGVLESFYQAYSKTTTWLYLYEKYKQNT